MRLRITLACCAALVLSVGVATATSANRTIIIDGHFTETYPKPTAPHFCFSGDVGTGMLKGLGKAWSALAMQLQKLLDKKAKK